MQKLAPAPAKTKRRKIKQYGKRSIDGQLDLFSLLDNNEQLLVLSAEDNIVNSEIKVENLEETVGIKEIVPRPSSVNTQQELELEEGDIIWAIVDKKLESHIVIKAQKDHCIIKSEDGQTRRLTARSKGICWEHTREKAQELQEKNKY